jgi:hypothetical protein
MLNPSSQPYPFISSHRLPPFPPSHLTCCCLLSCCLLIFQLGPLGHGSLHLSLCFSQVMLPLPAGRTQWGHITSTWGKRDACVGGCACLGKIHTFTLTQQSTNSTAVAAVALAALPAAVVARAAVAVAVVAIAAAIPAAAVAVAAEGVHSLEQLACLVQCCLGCLHPGLCSRDELVSVGTHLHHVLLQTLHKSERVSFKRRAWHERSSVRRG